MQLETMRIDDKWSIEFNPAQNDRPEHWLRHGERHKVFSESNAVLAMFYALREATQNQI